MHSPSPGITLVIPVFNESASLPGLISSLEAQTLLPDEIIWVDGGSTDQTPELISRQMSGLVPFRVIKAGRAYPGKGRNIGAVAANTTWIAFTDAGIILAADWLEQLSRKKEEVSEATIIYGNFSPRVVRVFEKASAIAYVPAAKKGYIRYRSVVSCLLKKQAWEFVGGFPDWRATEDLIFMEKLEKAGFAVAYCPEAMATWELRPDLGSTYKKFDLYSKYNVWAGRQAHWHYGVLRQYIVLFLFLLGGLLHHWLWFLFIPAWFLARAAKRIWQHRQEFAVTTLVDPRLWVILIMINLVIDAATFTGWIKAVFSKPPVSFAEPIIAEKPLASEHL